MFIMYHKYWSLEQMGKDLLRKILREMKMNKYFLHAFSSLLMVKLFCVETKMSDIHYKYYFGGKASLNKFQAVNFWLSPLQTTNWALSAWTKYENISGDIASLSLVMWATCWNGHSLPSQFNYCFVLGRWISAQVFNRSITMVMCSNAQQIPNSLKTRLTQDVQNITFWGTCTWSGTKGRVLIFSPVWF